MRWTYLALIAGCLSLTTGCGAIFTGTKEQVRINSSPQGAAVKVDGVNRGQTPTEVTLNSDQSHTIQVEKEGYAASTRRITSSLGAGWLVLDILGGFWPIVIDAATGGWHTLERDIITVNLSKSESAKNDESKTDSASFDTGPVTLRVRY